MGAGEVQSVEVSISRANTAEVSYTYCKMMHGAYNVKYTYYFTKDVTLY